MRVQAKFEGEAGTRDKVMSDQMQSEIAEINQKIEQIDDPRRCYALVQERIRKLRQAGRMVPDDLARIERQLMVECLAESQGR
jgi:chorismate mutase